MQIFRILILIVLFGCSASSCKKKDTEQHTHSKSKAFNGDECAACGMIVREQSSPRGQLVHRDGKRKYFCSISDMLSYLESPSPHGKVVATFVEVQPPQLDPLKFDKKQRTWLPVNKAFYILGVKKPRVMGVPILVFKEKSTAARFAKQLGGTVVAWDGLQPAWRKHRDKKK